MSNQILSISEAGIGTLVVAAAYFYVYLRDRAPSMKLWTIGWIWLAARLGLELVVEYRGRSLTGASLTHIADLMSAYFLLAGSYRFVGRQIRRPIPILFGAAAVWVAVAGSTGVGFWAVTIPPLALMGGAMIRMGVLLVSADRSPGIGNWAAGVGPILWGIHKLDYLLLRNTDWFAPIGFTISGLLALVTGVGMLIAYLDRTHQRTRMSENRFQAIVESMEDIVITTDAAARVVDAYGCWFDRNRIPRSHLVGRLITETLTHRHDMIVLEEVGRAFAGEVRHQTMPVDLSGTERWFSFALSPMRDGHDRVVGVLIVGRDITDCAESSFTLAERLQENETLLQEVHHRVKNNMQIMASLLSLQSGRMKDPGDRLLMEESSQRIQTMAHVHEQLYASQSLTHVQMSAYIRELTSRLAQTYGCGERGIQIRAEVDEIDLMIERAVPCAQILHELITNALKHAFTGREYGAVCISLKRCGADVATLTVRDNGRGFDAKSPRVGPETLGMKLVELLSRQLDGTASFSNSIGTRFDLTFPCERRDA